MKTAYELKIANKKDAVRCINLSKTSWPDWWSINEKAGKMHIRKCIEQKNALVATKNLEVIAFLVWGTIWNKIHVQDIFVKEKYRKAGIGTKLMEFAIQTARKEGFKEVVSDCDVSNKMAISFHLNNGFKKCGYIKNNWDNEDSFVFSKKIGGRINSHIL